MMQAFFTGISSMQNMQVGIDVITDNLANTSTIGFKGQSTEFSSMLNNEKVVLARNSIADSVSGQGSQIQATPLDMSGGSLILSDRNTDLAIDGDGWFGVSNGQDTVYTRNGGFTFDGERDLVTFDGYHLLGTIGNNIDGESLTQEIPTLALGDVNSQEPLNFPVTLTYPAVATTQASFGGNLGTDNETRSMSSKIVDANGNRNNLKLVFNQTNPQPETGVTWDVVATVTDLEGNITYDTQSGVVTFDDAGGLSSSTLPNVNNNGSSVNIDLGSGYSGLISSSGLDISASSSADGLESGDLIGYEVNANAEVIATFSNGRQSAVGKIALYHFQNDQGLTKVGDSRFTQGPNSGNAIFYKDAEGNNILGATVQNFKLEGSNVKFEVGLTELIIMQRAYDANSKTITTADQMLQKALSMDA